MTFWNRKPGEDISKKKPTLFDDIMKRCDKCDTLMVEHELCYICLKCEMRIDKD